MRFSVDTGIEHVRSIKPGLGNDTVIHHPLYNLVQIMVGWIAVHALHFPLFQHVVRNRPKREVDAFLLS